MPHTVRRRVCAIRPTTMALNVVNVGVVKQDRKTANRAANEPGTEASTDRSREGGASTVDASLIHPGHPRSTVGVSPTITNKIKKICETRAAL